MFATLVASTFLFSCSDLEVIPTINVMDENNVVHSLPEDEVLRQAEANTVEVEHVSLDKLNQAFIDAGLEPISEEKVAAILNKANSQAPNPTQCFYALNNGAKLASNPNVLTTFDVVRARQVILFCGSTNTETTQSEMIADISCITQYTGLAAAYNSCTISWPNTVNTLSETDNDIMICAILGYC